MARSNAESNAITGRAGGARILLAALAAGSFLICNSTQTRAGEKVELLRTIEINPRDEIIAVAFSSDDRNLTGATIAGVVSWDVSDGAERKRWQAKSGRV